MRRREVSFTLLGWAATAALRPPMVWAGNGHPKTAAEAAAGATITDSSLAPGDWRRYGADPSGATDSAVAIQAAVNANSLAFDAVGGSYLVSKQISVPAGVTVRGAGASATLVSCPDGGTSVFRAADVSGVVIERLKIAVTARSALAYTGAVEFFRSSNCRCSDCEIVGCNWAGILLNDASACTVERCHLHDFQGLVHDSADICVYRQSHHNSVTANRCFGGNWHGILIQDPYAQTLPGHNTVADNIVGAHRAYGITVYIPSAGDTFNQLIGNSVENIEGSVLENASGAGIYVVGAGAGGTTLARNTVRNCCLQTTARTLAPAGIGVNGIQPIAAPVTVRDNIIIDVHRYDGVLVVSSKGAVTLSGNQATLAPGNSEGTPIRIEASSNVSATGNTATRDAATRGRCIFVYADAIAVSMLTIDDNQCYGGSYAQIELAVDRGGSITQVKCTGNICHGTDPNTNCVQLPAGTVATVANNRCLAR